LLNGKNPHHIVEAEFKALARALGDATARAPGRGVPSTKGSL
jgi:imidazoleglycerol-phosphate dehydratase